MKRTLRIVCTIILLLTCLKVIIQAEPVQASVSTSTFLLDNSKIPFSVTIKGNTLVLNNIPATGEYDTFWIALMNSTSDDYINDRKYERNETGSASYSFKGVAEGSYYLGILTLDIYGYYSLTHMYKTIPIEIEGDTAYFPESVPTAINQTLIDSIPVDAASLATYLEPDRINEIDSDDPSIIKQAKNITADCKDVYSKIIAIHDWIVENIYYDYDALYGASKDFSTSAVYTLKNKRNVCMGYSNLTTALLRASGIPAINIIGYADFDNLDDNYVSLLTSDVNHEWTAAYLTTQKRWVILDTTFDSKNTYMNGVYEKGNASHEYCDPALRIFSFDHHIFMSNNFNPITSITLDSAEASLMAGDNVSLTASVSPSDALNQNLYWVSSDSQVASVDQSGLVNGISEGTASITAYATDGSKKKASCSVSVKIIPATSLSISESRITITEYSSATLSVINITPDNASIKTVTWKTSDPKVATINSKGTVTAVSRGKATITCVTKDGSGLSASCAVTVTSDPLIPVPTLTERLEAEKAKQKGWTNVYKDSIASNGKGVEGWSTEDSITFSKVSKANYLVIAYVTDYYSDSKLSIDVNGKHYKTIVLPSLEWRDYGSYDSYKVITVSVDIPQNADLCLRWGVEGGRLAIDYIELKNLKSKVNYTATFNSSGGSYAGDISVKKGTKITVPDTPTKKGYIFDGWYTSAEDGEKVEFPYVVKDNVIFYAHWRKK